ncbi:putative metal-binding motif-containing protein [Corallococcus exercitus]|uniref:putative metal-binding motif-containing protein n=1 Tax=Corallococcus exercitus TaxID=2316736 RepID=UPI001315067E|nr:putative metal-binding motif-containing protein [Corallococcus exercitus]
MRLFLLAVLTGVLAGCSKGDDLKSAALSVKVHYEGFRPGCVSLTVTDQAEVSRHVTTNVNVSAGPPPGTLSVAVFRQAGWSNDVRVEASAKEQSCDGAQVATAQADASLAKDGITPVELSLSAMDSDGDGFVRLEDQGTDCNDRDANLGGPKAWYPDDDNDGYGNLQLPAKITACEGPALTASRTGDCNDRDSSVHPDQTEFRCDGQDDNCDDVKDESFDVGGTCLNDVQCPGAKVCANGGVACNSTVTPTAYYFDEDGDGKAGADGGVTCGPPPSGTVAEFSDCDESSVYVNKGLPEVCDRLDNNCSGGAPDEGLIGCTYGWLGSSGGGGQPRWSAIAVGQDVAWLAGEDTSNNVLKVQTTVQTPSTCAGGWSAAWVSATGQLFLAGTGGKLASKTLTQSDCTIVTTPGSNAELTGIVGFNSTDGSPPTLYAVSSNGFIFRWVSGSTPVHIATTGINLRAVHAAGGPETMLAVGAKDFGVTDPLARAVRFVSPDAPWQEESLPAGLPSTFLNGVHVVSANYAYAVGNKGIVLERNHGVWRQVTSLPSSVDLTDVVAFGQKALYVTIAQTGAIQFFDGTTWTSVYSNARALRALDASSPTRIGASGDQGVYQFFYRP